MKLAAQAVTVAAALAVAAAGCDASAGTEAVTRGPPEPASPGEPPTVAPAPVEGWEDRAPRPTVIASGYTPGGDPFEIVVYGTDRGPCLMTLHPAQRLPEAGGACGETFIPELNTALVATGTSSGGRESQVYGFVSRAVDSVRLSIELDGEPRQLDAVTEQIPRRLLHRLGAPAPVGIFVGFFPRGIHDVTATAFGAAGEELGSATWADPEAIASDE